MATETLTIVVAEDDLLTRELLHSYLERRGHAVILAENGQEAVDAFDTHSPDLAILDVKMPVMDGMAACRSIKARMAKLWVPVLLISSNTEEQDQVSGLGVGADYYLTKPISFPILEATVQSSQRIAALQRQIEASNEELTAYYRRSQIENELAQQMIERIVANAGSDDSRIHQSVRSVEDFSGDVVSTVTLESGQTYAMLADATGHGLPAAITLLPAMEIFYQMSQRGYTVASIVRQINRRMRERLPPNHFLAANVILVNPQQRALYIWNGGCPCAYVLSRNEGISQRIHSAHPPLGILDDADFDDRVQQCHVELTDHVFACSDGLTETRNESGEMFGTHRLEELLQACANAEEHETSNAAISDLINCAAYGLRQFRGRALPGDDQSMVALSVEPPPVFDKPQRAHNTWPSRPNGGKAAPSGWEFELELRGTDLRHTEIVPTVNQVLEHLMLDRDTRQRAFVVLTELLNNALDHGVLELSSAHKENEGGFERYFEQRRDRLEKLDQGFIKISVSRSALLEYGLLRLMVSDSGSGFDAPIESDAGSANRFYGRGLQLVNNLTDGLRFLDKGASVEAEFRIEGR